MQTCLVHRLGVMEYETAWRMQAELADQVAKKQRPPTLLLLEHPHIYTFGRSGHAENLIWDEAELSSPRGQGAVGGSGRRCDLPWSRAAGGISPAAAGARWVVCFGRLCEDTESGLRRLFAPSRRDPDPGRFFARRTGFPDGWHDRGVGESLRKRHLLALNLPRSPRSGLR